VDEDYPLDYEGPYGCSKGIGDAYCLDYARTFDLRAVVFRMSGIYGTSQHPTEDQAWVAWFVRRAMESKPITIFGDGKQVRDILFVSDLVDAFERVITQIDKTRGEVYNIGGGRENSISVLELLELMESELGIKPSEVSFDAWRRADQKVYISNTAKAEKSFGWKPQVSKAEGVTRLYNWMKG
jgi:CDP-paratose 2-epimerase